MILRPVALLCSGDRVMVSGHALTLASIVAQPGHFHLLKFEEPGAGTLSLRSHDLIEVRPSAAGSDLDDQIQEAVNSLNALLLAAFNAGHAVAARVEPISADIAAPMVIVDVTDKP